MHAGVKCNKNAMRSYFGTIETYSSLFLPPNNPPPRETPNTLERAMEEGDVPRPKKAGEAAIAMAADTRRMSDRIIFVLVQET